ncbi:MAG: sensor histidine kinase [Eubacterium sp.]|nr:sensor histidine kinase [Eubacterium sp.]
MTVKKYVKDKIIEIIIAAVVGVIILWLLTIFKVNLVAITLITGLFILSWISDFIYDYNRRKGFYNRLSESVTKLDKAYLVLETMETPGFLEGEIISEILYEIDKSMAENVALYQKQSKDFSEYIEMWLHEVKLPLSAISLKLHNLMNLDIDNTEYKKLLAETRRIETLVNQVLYYVRSGSIEKDYHIAKSRVADIIHETAMTYRENLQDNNIDFIIDAGDTDINAVEVNTDQKWFIFIMGQLISNSIKYKREGVQSFVKIVVNSETLGEGENGITISVEDNGIGIPEKDLRRVFEKSFTGFNGEGRTKSTGMGLYIVKELCKKLGHEVTIESKQSEWTRVNIRITNDSFYDVM